MCSFLLKALNSVISFTFYTQYLVWGCGVVNASYVSLLCWSLWNCLLSVPSSRGGDRQVHSMIARGSKPWLSPVLLRWALLICVSHVAQMGGSVTSPNLVIKQRADNFKFYFLGHSKKNDLSIKKWFDLDCLYVIIQKVLKYIYTWGKKVCKTTGGTLILYFILY